MEDKFSVLFSGRTAARTAVRNNLVEIDRHAGAQDALHYTVKHHTCPVGIFRPSGTLRRGTPARCRSRSASTVSAGSENAREPLRLCRGSTGRQKVRHNPLRYTAKRCSKRSPPLHSMRKATKGERRSAPLSIIVLELLANQLRPFRWWTAPFRPSQRYPQCGGLR